jgi:hypothetical protein
MKLSCVIVFGIFLVGCASSQPKTSLSAGQATRLAIQAANTKAEGVFQCQPFHDGQTARLESGHWVWRELVPGDYEAEVEIAADGSIINVDVNLLSDLVNRKGITQ